MKKYNLSNIIFQSTHPMRGATREPSKIGTRGGVFQSTHPMRGATKLAALQEDWNAQFQSTHPMRGATAVEKGKDAVQEDFNPRTPCGVRRMDRH